MKYKLLVLDVDGTLVESSPNAKVSKKLIEAIKKINKSIKISLCTGRAYPSANKIIRTLGIKDNYHVIESGSKIVNPRQELENIRSLTYGNIKEIVGVVRNLSSRFGYCVNGKWESIVKENGNETITVVAVHSENSNQTDSILNSLKPLEKKFNINTGSKWDCPKGAVVHVTNINSSKESGVAYVQNKLGVKKVETIGIGDMLNDLPLFKQSGLKVAMGNATQELKNRADTIAPSVNEDGVAWVIEKYLISD